ncbi:unnamed protein product [Macrosiphum euphorbiae]|uniref:Uncharacterized protein n=1 Tax=Macrosiphum euphorbiae TaxID=13131 RepID=A0AAV0WHE4_9HEMI|nr:unnamed protein product [Macrosiphum euphorbiae]
MFRSVRRRAVTQAHAWGWYGRSPLSHELSDRPTTTTAPPPTPPRFRRPRVRDHHYRVPAVSTSPSRQRTDGDDGSNPAAYIHRPAATTGTTHDEHTVRTLEVVSSSSCSVRYRAIGRSDDNVVSSYGSTEG